MKWFGFKLDIRKLYLSLVGVVVAIVLSLIGFNMMPIPADKATIPELLFTILGGYIPLDGGIFGYFYPVLMLSLPLIIQLALHGSLFVEDFDRASAYIFTRTNKRTIWYHRKCLELFCYCAVYYLIQLITISVTGFILGLPLGEIQIAGEVLVLIIVLGFGVQLLYVFLANVLSLQINNIYSFLICYLGYAPLFLVMIPLRYALAGWLLRLQPFSQGILSFHEVPSLKYSIPEFFTSQLNGFYWWHSLVYILIALLIIYAFGRKSVNKIYLIKH